MSTTQTAMSPTVEEVYNLIMREIEPELTTDMLPTLGELYPDETPQEWKKRQERYQRAFALYETRFTALMDQWKQDIVRARDALVASSKK